MKNDLRHFTENQESLLRPAWTSTKETGMFESYKHQHGRSIRRYFYERSEGLYQITRKNAE